MGLHLISGSHPIETKRNDSTQSFACVQTNFAYYFMQLLQFGQTLSLGNVFRVEFHHTAQYHTNGITTFECNSSAEDESKFKLV